ncbi:uncharacterized protein BO97DRAFT_403928 [Aspergillus homomorphus CBS 101889]|uniref:Uncharacterized protein n=1 Tax=Aspergillus homomorphus (strain CBS 101889) TaxID=1450537 RepID=A0A395I3V6_ASPHC|nr:hypothetical protein BO97DRAFT_403928 [Aspergillus homomorphus CBS 101889]RAL14892.1 hypothetical protein BO97DRAFT_403928 [Aspergillus homomorphus CBS 101889]
MSEQNKGNSLFPPVVKAGALSGSLGLVYGGVAGVIRSPNPVIHSLSCGVQWAATGSGFWFLRENILKYQFENNADSKQRAYVSALSGGIAGGTVTRLLGGRLIPGVVFFSALGYLGQSTYNAIDAWQLEKANTPSKPILQRIADSKWIPLKSLSDDDYRGILREKLLSIEAEIAILDEKIEALEKLKSQGPELPSSDSATR